MTNEPTAAPEVREDSWWCPTCDRTVPPLEVTNDVRHDERCGGCGNAVLEERPEVSAAEQSGYGRAVRDVLDYLSRLETDSQPVKTEHGRGWIKALRHVQGDLLRGDHRPKGTA